MTMADVLRDTSEDKRALQRKEIVKEEMEKSWKRRGKYVPRDERPNKVGTSFSPTSAWSSVDLAQTSESLVRADGT